MSKTMDPPGSITLWLDQLKAGDPDAAERLWQRYFTNLVALARQRLADRPRPAADEEDVALSAFACFCHAAERGQLPRLADRHDLWWWLVRLTERKACDLARREDRQKRGSSQGTEGTAEEVDLDQIPDLKPTPEMAALLADELRHLLACLDDDLQRNVALLKLEGCSDREIADRLERPLRTVERKLQLIRKIWQAETCA